MQLKSVIIYNIKNFEAYKMIFSMNNDPIKLSFLDLEKFHVGSAKFSCFLFCS